jgi:hypothetical protein
MFETYRELTKDTSLIMLEADIEELQYDKCPLCPRVTMAEKERVEL